MGSKRGEEVSAAQKQVRGKHQEANGIKSPREANTSPQKANGHTPVYIKKNQRGLAEKLAQREITEMNLKNAGLRTG